MTFTAEIAKQIQAKLESGEELHYGNPLYSDEAVRLYVQVYDGSPAIVIERFGGAKVSRSLRWLKEATLKSPKILLEKAQELCAGGPDWWQ